MGKQNDFGAWVSRSRKHNLSLPEHVLSVRYLRDTIACLMRTFDEVKFCTEPGNSVEAKCADGRTFRITIEQIGCSKNPDEK